MDHASTLLARFASIPPRVSQAIAWGDQELLAMAPAPGEWSAREIIAHLRASDDIVTPRLIAVLVRDRPPLTGYDERRWAEVVGYAQHDTGQALTLFALRRAELARVLEGIGPEDWQRQGVHEVIGPLTLLDMLTRFVEHEEEHCAQLEALARS